MHIYEIGDLIDDRYIVIGTLGGGGFGKVVSVFDKVNNLNVALKYYYNNDQNLREEFLKRFSREIRMMKEIDNKNVVNIIDYNLEHEPPYFTMPKADGSVKDLVGKFENHEKAITVFLEICEGVMSLHNSGIVHRDIKPENALVYSDRIVLSDLGLAKHDHRNSTVLTRTNIKMGTEGFLAPEQYDPGGTKYADQKVDIYQLGKTLYHMVTGRNPLTEIYSDVAPGLKFIISKATRQDPNKRYRSVSEFMDALNDHLKHLEMEQNNKEIYLDLMRNTSDMHNAFGFHVENDILKMLQFLLRETDNAQFIDLFHQTEPSVITEMLSSFEDDFFEVLKKYKEIITDTVVRYPFTFAESVAIKMKDIFQQTNSEDIKALAIISALKAAVYLNRFYAMDVFNEMLISVKREEDAYAIAEQLEDSIEAYSRIVNQVSKKDLHRVFHSVWENASNL
ncbi:serine/threonine-protein kinase [Shouchella clausii]|uniref:serine/threonine-protein kinase n=1 Tax=Shouchella clausii TaxID=79880 RepID=UPI0028A29C77|nr:serine/threonine-protein kinase [Shouchella clausii]